MTLMTSCCCREGGRPMHHKPADARWQAALRRAGIPDDRYHMMHVTRHTFVSACLSSGLSVRAVAEFISDTEGTVQKTYSHMMPDDRECARKAKAQFFRRPSTGESGAAGVR